MLGPPGFRVPHLARGIPVSSKTDTRRTLSFLAYQSNSVSAIGTYDAGRVAIPFRASNGLAYKPLHFYVEVLPNPLFVASPIHNRLSKLWLAVCRPLFDDAYFPRCSVFGCSYSAHSITMWLAIVINHLRLGTVVVSETHYLRLIKHTLGTDSLPEVHNPSRIPRGNT